MSQLSIDLTKNPAVGAALLDRYINQLRHSQYYLSVMTRASSLYESGGKGVQAGLQLFDLEWDQIAKGQEWASEHKREKLIAASLCNEYARFGVGVLEIRGLSQKRVNWLEHGRTAAQIVGDTASERQHMVALGNHYLLVGRFHTALGFFSQSSRLSQESTQLSEVEYKLGVAYSLLGKEITAISHFENARRFAVKGDRYLRAKALLGLGSAQKNLFNTESALLKLTRALKIFTELGKQQEQAETLFQLAQLRSITRINDQDVNCLSHSIATAQTIGDRRLQAYQLIFSSFLEGPEQAIVTLRKALELCRDCRDLYAEGRALLYLGVANLSLGNEDIGTKLIEKSVDNANDRNDKTLRYICRFFLALHQFRVSTWADESWWLWNQILQIDQEEDLELKYLTLVHLSQILIKGVWSGASFFLERDAWAAVFIRKAIEASGLRNTDGIEGKRLRRRLNKDLNLLSELQTTQQSSTRLEQQSLSNSSIEERLQYHLSQLESAQEYRDELSKHRSLLKIQHLLHRLRIGKSVQALDYCRKYLETVQDLEGKQLDDSDANAFRGDYIGEWLQLGDDYLNVHEFEKALDVYEHSLRLALHDKRYFIDDQDRMINPAPLERASRLKEWVQPSDSGSPGSNAETNPFPPRLSSRLNAVSEIAGAVLEKYAFPSHPVFFTQRETVVELNHVKRCNRRRQLIAMTARFSKGVSTVRRSPLLLSWESALQYLP
jgi:tetratricopeptide (TPR) repeat protein